MNKILINIDIGERGPHHAGDRALIPYADIVNVACGGHAGSARSVDSFRIMAEERNIMVMAHVSYPDKPNFGRTTLKIPFPQLRASLDAQLAMLPGVKGVKCHGALYNDCCFDAKLARNMGEWFANAEISCVTTLKDSELHRECQRFGIRVLSEAFAERRYTYSQPARQLSLVNRKEPNACITDLGEALENVRNMVHCKQVKAFIADSARQPKVRMVGLDADTICIHSDSPIALELAEGVAELLKIESSICRPE